MLMQDGVRGGKGRVFADVNFAESKAKSYWLVLLATLKNNSLIEDV